MHGSADGRIRNIAMPFTPPRVCGWCGGVHQRGERCAVVVKNDAERKARFDRKRPNSSRRGYDRQWEEAAKAYLAIHPYCVSCAAKGLRTKATVVMHIHSIRDRPDLRMDPTNWQAGCQRCNAQQAAQERQRSTT